MPPATRKSSRQANAAKASQTLPSKLLPPQPRLTELGTSVLAIDMGTYSLEADNKKYLNKQIRKRFNKVVHIIVITFARPRDGDYDNDG